MFRYGQHVKVRATGRSVMVKSVTRKAVICSWYEIGVGWRVAGLPRNAVEAIHGSRRDWRVSGVAR
jgi:hypothetical protein